MQYVNNWTIRIATLACTTCITELLSAQGDTIAPRSHYRNAAPVTLGKQRYFIDIVTGEDDRIRVSVNHKTLTSTTAVPWECNGGLDTNMAGALFASGLQLNPGGVGDGVITKMSFAESGGLAKVMIDQVMTYPGVDPVELRYISNASLQGLFVVDARGDRILFLPCQSGLPNPSSAITVANASTIPQLADCDLGSCVRFLPPDLGAGSTIGVGFDWGTSPRYDIVSSGSGFTVSSSALAEMVHDSPGRMSLPYPGQVFCSSDMTAGTIDVRDDSGALLHSLGVAPNAWVTLPYLASFETRPGRRHSISWSESNGSLFLFPTVQKSSLIATPHITPDRMLLPPVCRLGDAEYFVGAGVHTADPTGTLQCGLSIAFRSTADPIDAEGFLAPDLFLTFSVDPDAFVDSVGLNMPIPNDLALDGSVALFQMMFINSSTGAARTGIWGTTIAAKLPQTVSAAQVAASRAAFLSSLQAIHASKQLPGVNYQTFRSRF